jgi:hypothetical protein
VYKRKIKKKEIFTYYIQPSKNYYRDPIDLDTISRKEINATRSSRTKRQFREKLFDKERNRRRDEKLCFGYRKPGHIARDYRSKLSNKQVNTIITKTLVTIERVELSEEELEAQGIHRQIRLTESDIKYLDAEIERIEDTKEASSFFSSSSSSSESSYLLMNVVKSQKGEI